MAAIHIKSSCLEWSFLLCCKFTLDVEGLDFHSSSKYKPPPQKVKRKKIRGQKISCRWIPQTAIKLTLKMKRTGSSACGTIKRHKRKVPMSEHSKWTLRVNGKRVASVLRLDTYPRDRQTLGTNPGPTVGVLPLTSTGPSFHSRCAKCRCITKIVCSNGYLCVDNYTISLHSGHTLECSCLIFLKIWALLTCLNTTGILNDKLSSPAILTHQSKCLLMRVVPLTTWAQVAAVGP